VGQGTGGGHRAATLDRLAWRRIVRFLECQPLHGETSTIKRAKHAPPATQVRRNAHSTQQISSMQQRSTEMWRTSNSLYAPGPGRRRSARRQRYHYSTRRSQRRQSRSTGRRYKPATGRWALPSTTEQQTWLPQINPHASHRRTRSLEQATWAKYRY
jgi:hypothetical protein